MRKVFRNFAMLTMASSVALISSCGDNKKEEVGENHQPEVVEDVAVTEELHVSVDPDMTYSVPTPNELFAIIKETGAAFDEAVLNDPAKADSYTSKKLQALNFGIYSADLAFVSSFEQGAIVLKYFKTVRDLSDKMGISSAFDETVFKRVEDNINNGAGSDSLLTLSNDTYFQAYSYLEENDRGSTLALIVIGGWIESLYIMTNLNEYEEGSALVERIGEQKLTFENLMGFLMKYQDDPDVLSTMEELIDIEGLLLSLDEEEVGEAETSEQDGMYVLSGGTKILVTKDQFNQLRDLVKELRTEIVDGDL